MERAQGGLLLALALGLGEFGLMPLLYVGAPRFYASVLDRAVMGSGEQASGEYPMTAGPALVHGHRAWPSHPAARYIGAQVWMIRSG